VKIGTHFRNQCLGGFDLLVNAAKDANGTYKHTITSRVIQFIDCGFSLTLPNGYRLVIEGLSDHLAKGLVIHPAFSGEGKQRIALFAHNLGKEIIVLNHGDSIGRMYLTSLYKAKIKGCK
jgi:dUTPase